MTNSERAGEGGALGALGVRPKLRQGNPSDEPSLYANCSRTIRMQFHYHYLTGVHALQQLSMCTQGEHFAELENDQMETRTKASAEGARL